MFILKDPKIKRQFVSRKQYLKKSPFIFGLYDSQYYIKYYRWQDD
jgi:ABC-type uncharacterized transport system substrate-binding protein